MTKKRKMPKRAQRTGPWEALGISSSTYYRRKREGVGKQIHEMAASTFRYDPKKPLEINEAGPTKDPTVQGWIGKAANAAHAAIDTLSQGNGAPYRGETITFTDDHPNPTTDAANDESPTWARIGAESKTPADVAVGLAADAMRDAADTALVEQFLWEVDTARDFGRLPRDWKMSGRMCEALYNVLKDGKGE